LCPANSRWKEVSSAALPEVKVLLLFALLAIVNIPLAMSPPDAAQVFTTTFIRCVVMFIVMVNVVRTPARLKGPDVPWASPRRFG
jgi:hypothetical protein